MAWSPGCIAEDLSGTRAAVDVAEFEKTTVYATSCLDQEQEWLCVPFTSGQHRPSEHAWQEQNEKLGRGLAMPDMSDKVRGDTSAMEHAVACKQSARESCRRSAQKKCVWPPCCPAQRRVADTSWTIVLTPAPTLDPAPAPTPALVPAPMPAPPLASKAELDGRDD